MNEIRKDSHTNVDAINGLRGLFAFHIMVFHYIGEMTFEDVSINGSLEITSFFILSGYGLTLKYGSKYQEDNLKSPWRFYLKRIARLYPCYLFSNCLSWFATFYAMPIYFLQNITSSHILSTISMTNTWVWDTFTSPPATPTWTVCTQMAFYLIYPVILPVLQTFSSEMLQILIILMYQIQFLPYLLIRHIAPQLNVILYIHPVFKLPVFIIGISAGLLTLRGVEYPNHKLGYIHYVFPWNTLVQKENVYSTEATTLDSLSSKTKSSEAQPLPWARVTDVSSLILCATILYEGIRTSLELAIPSIEDSSQLFLCHLQLLVILGISKNQDQSFLSKVCKTRVCQFFGNFSMAIFMIHEPVIMFIIYNTSLKQEHVSTEIFGASISLLIAVIVTHILEKPLYNFVSRKIEINVSKV